MISTYKQNLAKEDHFEAEEAKKQLEGSYVVSKDLSDIAKKQQSDELESFEQLKAFAEQIEKEIAQFKKAIVLITSPESIAVSTPEDIHLSSDGKINQVASDSLNLSTQKNLIAQALNKVSVFAAQSGISAIAAQGKVELQAQGDALDVLAKSGITISSNDDKIEITSPKEIVITGASSQIKINGSGIFPSTSGKFEVKAGQHVFQPGQSVSATSKLTKASPLKGALNLLKSYGGEDFFKQNAYKVIDALGKEVKGKLDGNGFAAVTGIAPGPAKVEFDKDQRSSWATSSHFESRSYDWSNGFVAAKSSGGFLQNLLGGAGQNLVDQLKDNLFSLNSDSLKNIGKNVLNDLGGQALNQFTNQMSSGALGALSNQLNLNLSPDQIANAGQTLKSGLSTISAIQEQGLDFFKDQASAMLKDTIGQNLSSFSNGLVNPSLTNSYMPQAQAVDEPVVVTDNFISQNYYQSGGLTYTETIRVSQPEVAVHHQMAQVTAVPKNIEIQATSETKKTAVKSNADEPVVVKDSFIRQNSYSDSGGILSYTETLRVSTPEEQQILNAKK